MKYSMLIRYLNVEFHMVNFDFVYQAIEVSSEIKESVDVAPKEAGISEVPQMAVASAKQTETQASAVIGETLSGN